MAQKIFVVDAFKTDKPFSGNPAGVCILDERQSDEWMQQVAAEMKHSETAFMLKNDGGFTIRYFTPTIEVPLCGHATLASAHILWEEGICPGYEKITFYASGGVLKAIKEKDGISIDFPAFEPKVIDIASKGETETMKLNINHTSVYQSENDIVFELESEDQVKKFSPNFNDLGELPYRMIILTAKAKTCDFVSRVFAPSAGIDEDPATGIAHCILGPLWSKKLNKERLIAFQASKRGGIFNIHCFRNRISLIGISKLRLKGTFFS